MVYDMIYNGPSMNPTLKAGDELTAVPVVESGISAGDVVVFYPHGSSNYVVHRVVYTDVRGVRTRGDNNLEIDPWVLGSDNITGRVVSAKRKDKTVTIYGGTRGRIVALARMSVKLADLKMSGILHSFYHFLSESGFFRKLLSCMVKTKVVCLRRPGGTEMQLLMGGKVIGRRFPGEAGWQIRRPFRLFVNEVSLPDEKTGNPGA
jgi:signal peptidase I